MLQRWCVQGEGLFRACFHCSKDSKATSLYQAQRILRGGPALVAYMYICLILEWGIDPILPLKSYFQLCLPPVHGAIIGWGKWSCAIQISKLWLMWLIQTHVKSDALPILYWGKAKLHSYCKTHSGKVQHGCRHPLKRRYLSMPCAQQKTLDFLV